ncbi:hypothetical protein B0H66DRAFT_490297 [Apodospora peruviana]|uniref:lipoyl(octanoyl) transferase n=1 Tax=Apodospora peruviana TaxID=516989 RepID=A0AAE0MFT2_9PEZI|nr:hypothetical protein B0H66DRAFT_490297 [Apodospora peruviana]
MRLLHIHLPSRAPALYPPYGLASRLQEQLRRRQLDFKDAARPPPPGVTAPPPPPTLLSFTPLPVYTLGRRQTAPLTDAEVARLQAPLHNHMRSNHPSASPRSTSSSGGGGGGGGGDSASLPVAIVNSPRGGLTTYHGPGQVVLWPVLDLRSRYHRQFTVRCYSRLLEDTTIATLKSRFGLQAFTTDDPGVWVQQSLAASGGQPAKIAALGVHLRRHVSALGTAINVDMPGDKVRDEQLNPWARIVACGLEGKTVASVAGESSATVTGGFVAREGEEEQGVAAAWAEELASRISVEGVETMAHDDVVGLLDALVQEGGAGDERTAETAAQELAYVEVIRRFGQ